MEYPHLKHPKPAASVGSMQPPPAKPGDSDEQAMHHKLKMMGLQSHPPGMPNSAPMSPWLRMGGK